ncbi:MAG: hypothetical protein ACUVS2_12460 [Candidatus Flexifilum sp.]
MKRHVLSKGQIGQSIVILAIGFIALVGFVGIVTDVSLLFIRYSTLRRAVDAAAVAAAGQMRRIPDTTDNGIAEDQATSIANMNLAARTFIEYYGLSPRTVLVETCRAQNVHLDGAGRPMDNATPRNYLYLYDTSGSRIGPNPAADPQVRERYEQLCTEDELKLVRVTAQIDSPTAFLSILGFPTITLTETAISQTAVIDVVMIIDVSESMLNETGYDDWERIGQGVRYLPPTVSPYDFTAWGNIVGSTQNALNTAYASQIEVFRPTVASLDDVEPRVECRVRAWPVSAYGFADIPDTARATQNNPTSLLPQEYENYLTSTGRSMSYFSPPAPVPNPLPNPYTPPAPVPQRYWGFVPMYNFFGCCNDPDGNWRFDDAICQPFRDARDAAENFLYRLDFIRGDRIAFVTIDRRAHIVDPDGPGIQTPMIETQFNLTTGDPNTSRRGAYETLRDVVGVRAEPSFYADGEPGTAADDDGYWDGFNDGGRNTTWAEYMGNTGIRIGEFLDHPVFDQCPFDMAMLQPEFSLVDFYPNGTPRTSSTTLMNDVINSSFPGLPAWFNSVGTPGRDPRFYNYEESASCAGSNYGGGLKAASNVLFSNARREGAVWIMVFLSDGAAGASNPMTRQQSTPVISRTGPTRSVAANPYNTVGGNYVALPGEYGGFGLCPQGTQVNPGRWVITSEFPVCSDIYPQTRHFCGNQPANPDLRPIDVTPGCDIDFYDVDDYARDWADWIGLANLPGVVSGSSGRVADQQLPTIFTIGFGLAFERPPATSGCSGADDCLRRGNIPDTLGEELLRYIADVGDNFRIDDDYQQYVLGPRIPNRVDVVDPDWGVRGPCERPALFAAQRGTYMPLPPRQSCGNYFNAVNGDALEDVFNQIAQRMFTRLSQ